MIDQRTEFGARAARHLREETVVWLTTVTPWGAPLPRPVGFLWNGGENVSVYSQPGARIRNIGRNPKVTLNFRGDAKGGDIVVLSGTADRSLIVAAPVTPARDRQQTSAGSRAGSASRASAARRSTATCRNGSESCESNAMRSRSCGD
jgi:PPOX class probable F420-dependent enzyme